MSSLVFLLFFFAVNSIECTIFEALGWSPVQYPCFGTNTHNPGTCRTFDECTARGEVADGSCLLANSICCLPSLRCDGTTTANNSYFANADYPNATNQGSICSLKTSLPFNAAYVRLEFNVFEVMSTSTDGVCNDDYLLIEGAKQTVPKICGKNSGQHLYLPVEPYGTLTLKMVLSSTSTSPRKWLIKIIHLESNNPSLPPFGCLQYYSALDGRVNSFNFDIDNRIGNGNLGDFNYRVCFASHHGFCRVQLTTDYFEMNNTNLNRRRREDEKVKIPMELFEELMKQNEEFNRLHGNNSETTTDTTQTTIATETTEAPFTESSVGLITNACQNQDSLYFSPIHRQDILPVFCGSSLRFSVSLIDEPYFIRVRNTGVIHGKGFSLKYKYLIC